jgi:hypothetical protein
MAGHQTCACASPKPCKASNHGVASQPVMGVSFTINVVPRATWTVTTSIVMLVAHPTGVPKAYSAVA